MQCIVLLRLFSAAVVKNMIFNTPAIMGCCQLLMGPVILFFILIPLLLSKQRES